MRRKFRKGEPPEHGYMHREHRSKKNRRIRKSFSYVGGNRDYKRKKEKIKRLDFENEI